MKKFNSTWLYNDNEIKYKINNQLKQTILNTVKELNINRDNIKYILSDFQSKYGISALNKLQGKELLYRIFAKKTMDSKSLIYALEFDKTYQKFGGVGGGAAFKYTLYYSDTKESWISGSHFKNIKKISEEEAILYTEGVKEKFIKAFNYLENLSYNTVDDINYARIGKDLSYILGNLFNRSWVSKYLYMMFPEIFTEFYTISWTKWILEKLNIKPEQSFISHQGQIVKVADELNITTHELYTALLTIRFENPFVEELIKDEENNDQYFGSGNNVIVYGTPGCGKSYHVKNEILSGRKNNVYRTTFFSEYTNTDFIGQILPVVNGDKVTYEFTPGPFAIALKQALSNPNEEVALVIEELNRGNAASIFGDIFQLLDRDDTGTSEYSINNINLQKYLTKELNKEITSIVIPSNMSLIATMNTSDQNVFTLDTAFKRRWNFKKLKNTFTDEHEYKDIDVPGMNISWEVFVTKINDFIVQNNNIIQSEDKQLGVYFIDKKVIDTNNEESISSIEEFAHKVLEYLWNDVARFERSRWFRNAKTLDDLIESYISKANDKKSIEVFSDGIFN
ncbi:MAG: AAA family ATPase [bacterium]